MYYKPQIGDDHIWEISIFEAREAEDHKNEASNYISNEEDIGGNDLEVNK